MTNDAIVDADGNEVYEGIQDAIFTSLIAMHGLKGGGANGPAAIGRPLQDRQRERRLMLPFYTGRS